MFKKYMDICVIFWNYGAGEIMSDLITHVTSAERQLN